MEAATYLPVIGSRNGKTAARLSSTQLRIVPFRHSVWKCRGYILPLLFFSHEYAQRRLSHLPLPLPAPPPISPPFRFIRPRSAFDCSFVRLSVHLSARQPILLSNRRIRSRISVRRDARIVLLFSFGNLLAGSLVFTRESPPPSFLSRAD